jgi:hypothetical protein
MTFFNYFSSFFLGCVGVYSSKWETQHVDLNNNAKLQINNDTTKR